MPGHEGRQHLQADIGQGAAQQRAQHVLQRTVDGAIAEHVLAPAQGQAHQRLLAGQAALVVETLAAVADPGYQHAVDPALEHGRHREPVEREVEDHEIRPEQLVQLGLDVRGDPPGLDALALLQRIDQVVRVGPLGKVGGRRHRVPVHRVEVGDLHLVALPLQRFHGQVAQGAGEGLRLGVGVDDQYVHGNTFWIKREWRAGRAG
ncbi:hypothetical protein D9M68_53830 [compost metagenome]